MEIHPWHVDTPKPASPSTCQSPQASWLLSGCHHPVWTKRFTTPSCSRSTILTATRNYIGTPSPMPGTMGYMRPQVLQPTTESSQTPSHPPHQWHLDLLLTTKQLNKVMISNPHRKPCCTVPVWVFFVCNSPTREITLKTLSFLSLESFKEKVCGVWKHSFFGQLTNSCGQKSIFILECYQ